MAAKDYIHGHSVGNKRTPTYNSWRGMKARCDNPKHPWYKSYGGRGITYDERWKKFEPFLEDMGIRPENYDLDRKDPDGNYCYENCQWTPQATNRGNRRIRGDVK